jgi:hypothetical protein
MDDRSEIVGLIQANFAGFADGDVGAMRSVDHVDATIWDVFEPGLIAGAQARAAFRKRDGEQSKQRGRLTITIEEPLVDTWENTALARHTLRFAYEPPGATDGHIRITDVFHRVDGRWLRIHHHEGMMPSGVPPIAEKPSSP